MSRSSNPADEVVTFDVLREARARLVGAYNLAENDDATFIELVEALDERMGRVALDDVDGQLALTVELNAEAIALRGSRSPDPDSAASE